MDIKEVYSNPRNFALISLTLVGRNKAENRLMGSGEECSILGAKLK